MNKRKGKDKPRYEKAKVLGPIERNVVPVTIRQRETKVPIKNVKRPSKITETQVQESQQLEQVVEPVEQEVPSQQLEPIINTDPQLNQQGSSNQNESPINPITDAVGQIGKFLGFRGW